MGLIINKPDFVGKFSVGKTNYDSLDAYILRYEEFFLIELLGVELFKLFKTAYTGDPTLVATPIYKTIFDVIRIDEVGCAPFQNNGMKSMILGMVWFAYVKEFDIKMTSSGAVIDASEVSSVADKSFMYQRYNECIKDQNVIHWYIDKNIAVYPLFNGIEKRLSHWSL